MKINEARLGERLVAYHQNSKFYGKVVSVQMRGEIVELEDALGRRVSFHSFQCRRIRARKRVWVQFGPHGHIHSTSSAHCEGFVEFIEVRKRK